MEPKQSGPLADVHAYLKSKDKDFTADLPTFEQDMQDDGARQQVYDYLRKQDKGFTATFDEFTQDLGVKKNSGGGAGSSGGETPPPAAGAPVDVPQGQPAPGSQPGDQPFQQLVGVTPEGLDLPGMLTPAQLTPEAAPKLETAPVGTISALQPQQSAPGDEYIAAGLPLPSGEELRAQEEARQATKADGFWSSFGKSLYNGLDLRRIGGNLLDYGGDLFQLLSNAQLYDEYGNRIRQERELGAPLTSDKPTDQLAADLLQQAQASDVPLSEAAQQGFLHQPSLAAAGNLLGSGLASIIPVAAASAVGGPAAGAGVGGALGISGTKDAARAAGIGDEEAAVTATILAPVQAALEAFGVSNPAVSQVAVRATLREALAASGGKLTAEVLGQAAKRVLPEIARRAAAQGLREGGTEFLQGQAEGAAKLLADATRDPASPGRYGITPMQALVTDPLEQGLAGAVLGGGLGVTHSGSEVVKPDLTTPPIDPRTFTYQPTGNEPALTNVRVLALDENTGRATVRGVDPQGQPVQREVAGGRLFADKAATAAQAQATDPVQQRYTVPGGEGQPAIYEAEVVGGGQRPGTVAVRGQDVQGQPVAREVPREALVRNPPASDAPGQPAAPPEAPTPPDATPETPQDAPLPTPRPATPEPGPAEPVVPVASAPTEPVAAPVEHLPAAGAEVEPEWLAEENHAKFNALHGVQQLAAMRRVLAGARQRLADASTKAARQDAQDEIAAVERQIKARIEDIRQDEYKADKGNREWRILDEQNQPIEQVVQQEQQRNGIPARPRRLPAAEPHPDHVTPLTKQQQATNDTLDALDRYNALDARARKGKAGSEARAEIARAGQQAGLTVGVSSDGKVTVTRAGKRVTRSNEYTATTPANNHVPLAERPTEVRAFAEKVLRAAEENIPTIQGLDLKVRGKELSARELQGAVEDVRAGKNTLRAQLLLDTLENAHRQGYVEKSEGTGLATRKYQILVGEFVGDAQPTARQAVPLADAELDAIYESDAKARQAVADYARPDGTIDYAKLAEDERALSFLFEVSDETAAKLAALARERAQPTQSTTATTSQPSASVNGAASEGVDARSPQSPTHPDGATPTGGAEQPAEVAPATLTERIATAKQEFSDGLDAFRAARKKGSGMAQSSLLGIPAFSPEEAEALTKMVRAAVKLGALKTKQVVARLRAQGLTDDDVTDEQLRPFVKQLLTDEGIRKPKNALPPNEPGGSATRRSMARLDADPTRPEALRQRVRDTGLDKYEPKSLAETRQEVDAYMQRNSLSDAYAEAISTSDNLSGDVRTVLRERVLSAVGNQLTAALDRGDTAAADEYLDQSYKVAEAIAKRGTDAGREINAYKVLATLSPEAVTYRVQKDVQAQRAKQEQKLGEKAATEAKAVRQAKQQALANTLAAPAVRTAREKVAGKQPLTTRERRAELKAERDDLFAQLRALRKPSGQAYVSVVPITPQQVQAAAIHVKIFRTYLQEGLTHISDLVARFKRDAGPAAAGYPDNELRKQAAAAKGDHHEAIQQGTQALGKTLDQIARDRLTDPAAVGKTLAQQFVEGAGLNPADAKAYADAIEAEFARRIAQARQARLDQIAKRAQAQPAKRKPTPTDLDKTRALFTLSPTDDAAILDHLKRVNELPELTTQDVAELRKLAGKIHDAPDGFQKDEAVENLQKRIAQIKGISWADIGQSIWYANVLSGYKTHAINFTANLLQTGSELGVSTAYALGAGRGRYATAGAKGLAQGLKRGAREAYSVLATGREVSRTPDKYEVPGILENVRFAGGAANPLNYLKFVNRALRAGDVLFSSGLKEMRAHDLAVKLALEDAKSDGTPGQDVWARAAEKLYNTKERLADARAQAESEGLKGSDLERRIYEIAEQSRDAKLMEQAREYATRAVFNGDVEGGLGWVATGVQRITEGANWGGFKPGKYVVPFTRVITNVANAYLDYTPVGAARAIKGSTLLGGNAESKLQRQFTAEERWKLGIKAVIGTSVAAAAYALSNNKDENGNPTFELTGFGTGNPARDAQLRADGWQPYSIKIGGTWYSYANWPVAIMLAGVGSYNDGVKYGGEKADDQSALDKLAYNSFRALQFTKDMTALKGASDFLSAVDSRNPGQITQWAQRLAAGSAKGYVPFSALLTQLEKDRQAMTGQPKKQARSLAQMLVQDIPVARDHLNNALDVLGDPLPVDTDRLFSSAPHRNAEVQRIWDWLGKNNLFVSVPSRNSGGALLLDVHGGKERPMSDDEYYRYMRARGKLLKNFLLADIAELEKLTPEEAKEELRSYAKDASEQAKDDEFGDAAPLTTPEY